MYTFNYSLAPWPCGVPQSLLISIKLFRRYDVPYSPLPGSCAKVVHVGRAYPGVILNEDRKIFSMQMWYGALTCYLYLELRSVITEYGHGNAKCTVQKIITYHKYAEATSLFSLKDQLIINTEADIICFEHFTCTRTCMLIMLNVG